MEKYKNLEGHSGVRAFETGADFIKVKFEDATYLYDYKTTGKDLVEQMKTLARSGRGLSTFISRFVKNAYALKI